MKAVINLAADTTDVAWGAQAQQTTVLNVDNQQYPRAITLSTQGVRVNRPGVAVAFPISSLIALAIQIEPTLSWPPIITTQPVDATAIAAAAANFFVVASAELPISYQWQVSTNGGTTWANVPESGVYSGTQTHIMHISNTLTLNGYLFRCNVSNASGPTISNSALLTVDPDATGPTDQSVTAPAAVTFTITAFGLTPLSYQWQLSTDGGTTWGDLTNSGVYSTVTTATLHISDSTGLDGNKYRCTVTDTAGTIHSTAGTLTVL